MVAIPPQQAPPDNAQVAGVLDEVAQLLEEHEANPFRVRAWRNGAATVRALERPLGEILEEEGVDGLMALPGIGTSLSRAIEELVSRGRLGLLQRLRGDARPDVFTTVPGIGPELARRIHAELHIDSLHDLEVAASDGTLAEVPGMGSRRVRAVRESLAGRFRRGPPLPELLQRHAPRDEPPVEELLDVDREYLAEAAHGKLPRIAPRRFNPTGQAWLPVLHTERADRHYTALFSNTARAHGLGTTHDWVVLYRDDHGGHGQWTVITARFGALKGKRIVRGREPECRAFYEHRETPA